MFGRIRLEYGSIYKSDDKIEERQYTEHDRLTGHYKISDLKSPSACDSRIGKVRKVATETTTERETVVEKESAYEAVINVDLDIDLDGGIQSVGFPVFPSEVIYYVDLSSAIEYLAYCIFIVLHYNGASSAFLIEYSSVF